MHGQAVPFYLSPAEQQEGPCPARLKKVVVNVCRVSQVNHTRQTTFLSGRLIVLLMSRRCGYER